MEQVADTNPDFCRTIKKKKRISIWHEVDLVEFLLLSPPSWVKLPKMRNSGSEGMVG